MPASITVTSDSFEERGIVGVVHSDAVHGLTDVADACTDDVRGHGNDHHDHQAHRGGDRRRR